MARPFLQPGSPTGQINLRIPAPVISAVDELAARRGEARSTWLRRVIAEQIAAERGQHEEAVPAS